jgi:hypothetical protein
MLTEEQRERIVNLLVQTGINGITQSEAEFDIAAEAEDDPTFDIEEGAAYIKWLVENFGALQYALEDKIANLITEMISEQMDAEKEKPWPGLDAETA